MLRIFVPHITLIDNQLNQKRLLSQGALLIPPSKATLTSKLEN